MPGHGARRAAITRIALWAAMTVAGIALAYGDRSLATMGTIMAVCGVGYLGATACAVEVTLKRRRRPRSGTRR
jgi:disulfide bond formation protein DsbB